MSDDLAKWGRILYRSLKRGFHITPGEIQVVQLMVDRIEELEANLAKAAEAIDEAHTSMMNHCDSDAYLILDHALKELKGRDDE